MGEANSSVGHVPAEGARTWEFDSEVTRVFEDMLERSIPEYAVMRDAVTEVGMNFVEGKGRRIVDLGCSRGQALAPFIERCCAYATYLGVDASAPMVEACKDRFKIMEYSNLVRIKQMDLRREFPLEVGVDLCLAVLTLQFIPIDYRQTILEKVHGMLRAGGGLVIVEKVLGNSAAIDELMVKCYHGMKARNGYSGDEIERKALSLEGVLVPMTAEFNEMMLRRAGFQKVDCFWRWMNFAAWVAIA
jgi:tRNA (cmo5U34)-methyltransferase